MNLRVASLSSLTVAMLLAFAAGGCGEGASKQTGARGGAGAAVPVEVMVLRPEPLAHTINTTGTLLANEEVELRPEIVGRIIGVHFQEGGRVAKGALLLKINDSDYKAQLQRKESEEKLAVSDEVRKRALFESKAISQEDYDKSLNALRIVQADKAVIESQIAKTEIRAPFDGVIGLRHVSEGGYVSPNMLAATMQDIDPMKVEFSVPEKYVHKLRDGLEISVRVGESDTEHRGVIYAVESKIDPGTRTIKARARIPNPDGQLITGSFARIDITLEQIPDAIVIPTGAVIPELAGAKVYVCENGAARSIPVQTGIRTERSIQITQGLSANDTLIVTGLLQLSEGRKVAIRQRQAS